MTSSSTAVLADVRAAIDRLEATIRIERTPLGDHALGRAKREISARQYRMAHLPADLVRGPCWDLALVLYVAAAEGRSMYQAAAYDEAGLVGTTGHRAVERLEVAGWVQRQERASNRRRTIILTEKGLAAVAQSLAGG